VDLDISVIISTRNRAASLRETLTCLANADRTNVSLEVVVVDNGSEDPAATADVVHEFAQTFRVRVLSEPRQRIYGKSHALNRALDEEGLGEIIAVLDDDMSPHPDWFQGVAALCRRWPNADLFTGRSYVIWPGGVTPELARDGQLNTWMYSIIDLGPEDKPLGSGNWFSGNHFWFRSRCLVSGIRFDDIWLTEPKFMLDLVEMGYTAIAGSDAVAGHRVQERLLEKGVIRERAFKVGRSNADVRLRPYRQTVKHARELHRRPVLGRLFCCVKVVQASIEWLKAQFHLSSTRRFVAGVVALERLTYHAYLLQTAAHMEEYRVFGRRLDSRLDSI
jgi:glycosyltransferase involved in cell wall biosynthesis